MDLFAIVDEDMRIAKHKSRGHLAIFTTLEMLKKYAYLYQDEDMEYKTVTLEVGLIFDPDDIEGGAL